MSKQKSFNYKDRQIIRREHSLDDDTSTTLDKMLKICDNDLNAAIEIERWYDDTTIMLVWTTPETDEELSDRITKYEQELTKCKKKEKEGNAKKLELEKKEYLRLKKKFEKT